MLSHVSATGLENRVGFARISPPRCLPRESGPGREPGSGEQGAAAGRRPPRAPRPPASPRAGAERRGRMSRRPDRQREAGPGSAALQRGAAAHRGAVRGLGEGGACLRADAPAASKSRGAAAPAPGTRPGRGCGVSPAGLRPGGLAQGQARLGGWAQPGARPPSVSLLGAERTTARCAVTQDPPRGGLVPSPEGSRAVASQRL